jgi:hypothetical protein
MIVEFYTVGRCISKERFAMPESHKSTKHGWSMLRKRQSSSALQNVAALPNSFYALASWGAAALRRFPAK